VKIAFLVAAIFMYSASAKALIVYQCDSLGIRSTTTFQENPCPSGLIVGGGFFDSRYKMIKPSAQMDSLPLQIFTQMNLHSEFTAYTASHFTNDYAFTHTLLSPKETSGRYSFEPAKISRANDHTHN